MNTERLLRHRS